MSFISKLGIILVYKLPNAYYSISLLIASKASFTGLASEGLINTPFIGIAPFEILD